MYGALDKGDSAKALKIIGRLRKVIPDDPEILRGEYLARAMESANGKDNAAH